VPFYSQERRGLGGRSIRVWKLRTMHRDAEERLKTHLAADPAEHAEWFAAFKLRNDPRVVPLIGPLLRRFSIDELPQLWSVVKGEMSLVGPRPFPDYHLEQLTSEHRQSRKDVRPGLTGLWQVMVRSDGGMLEQQHYDLYYVRNWSIWLDLYVMGRTVVKVLSGRGAV
ncbi:MAG: sugar transferase, partial [Candidatus Binataceae bacterium]